jgi:hypothetical protein
VEQPTVRLAAMKAAEEAMDLRVGVGACRRRRRGCHSLDLEGRLGRRWTGRDGAWTGRGSEVGGGSADGRAAGGRPEVEKKALC